MRNSIVLVMALAASPALAHVTLTEPEAPAGALYTAHFRVGHGCNGAATTQLQIILPDEVSGVKPMAKPGWTIKIDKVKLATPQSGEGGRPITERVAIITWDGGPLPSDEFDDFTVLMRLPSKPDNLLFPAMQSCGEAMEHWMDMPDGKADHPAPVLKVGDAPGLPAGMGGHHEH